MWWYVYLFTLLKCSSNALFYFKHNYTLPIHVIKATHKILHRALSANQWLCIKDIAVNLLKSRELHEAVFWHYKMEKYQHNWYLFIFSEIGWFHLTLCSVNVLKNIPLPPCLFWFIPIQSPSGWLAQGS